MGRILPLLIGMILLTSLRGEAIQNENGNLKITKANFERFIVPQLENMLTEYFFIMGKTSDSEEAIVELVKDYAKQVIKFRGLTAHCLKTQQCLTSLEEIKRQFSHFDTQVLRIYAIIITKENLFKISAKTLFYLNLLLNDVFLIHEQLTNLYHFDDPIISHHDLFQKTSTMISTSLMNLEFLMIENLPSGLQKEFGNVWNDFMKIVQQEILPHRDSNVFLGRLEHLNLYWNSFPMMTTKGDMGRFGLPEQGAKIIYQMHLRWNSILKIILGL